MIESAEASMPAMEQQTPGPLTAAREALGNFAGRIAGGIRSGYETFQDISFRAKVVGAAAITAFTLAHAEAATADPDSAALENVPALTGAATLPGAPEATASDASTLTPDEVRQCKDGALARPLILNKPGVYRAGIRTRQSLRGEIEYKPLPDYCAPAGYLRVAGGNQQIKKHGRWVNAGFGSGAGILGNQDQRTDIDYTPTHSNPAYVYVDCVGGKFEKSRFVMTNKLKVGENHHRTTEATAHYVMELSVHGNCQAAVRSRKQAQKHPF